MKSYETAKMKRFLIYGMIGAVLTAFGFYVLYLLLSGNRNEKGFGNRNGSGVYFTGCAGRAGRLCDPIGHCILYLLLFKCHYHAADCCKEKNHSSRLDVDCQSSDFQNSAQYDWQIGNQCLSEWSCLLQHESGRTYHYGCVADCDHA